MHAQPCLTLCDPTDCSLPGFSVHGIFQAKKLEWAAISSPGDLPDPGIEPVSPASPALQADSLQSEPTRGTPKQLIPLAFSYVSLSPVFFPVPPHIAWMACFYTSFKPHLKSLLLRVASVFWAPTAPGTDSSQLVF